MVYEKKQVYVVDDDVGVSRALMVLLISYGFKVNAFSSSKDFFAAVPDDAPGCLILDIHMPGIDGWKTLEQFSLAGSKRSVILISADTSNQVRTRAYKAGVIGFLQKPFGDHALVNLLQKAFAGEQGH